MDDLREKVARAFCTIRGLDPDDAFAFQQKRIWEFYADSRDFRDTLAAIHASGHRIVPVEPTEEMVTAASLAVPTANLSPFGFQSVYRAMLTACGPDKSLAGHYLSNNVYNGKRKVNNDANS